MSFRWWLLTAISLFAIGLVFGLVTANNVPASLTGEITDIQRLSGLLMSLPEPLLLVAIFLKNVLVVLSSVVLSPLFFLVPVVTLLLNGWIIGIVSIMVIQEQSLGYLLAALLPHGIIELPALFIGEAIAFSFGAAVLRILWKDKAGDLKQVIAGNVKLLTGVVVLFLVAAVIETYITPAVLSLAM